VNCLIFFCISYFLEKRNCLRSQLAHANADARLGSNRVHTAEGRKRRLQLAPHSSARAFARSHRKLSILQLFLLFTQQQTDFQWIQFAPSQKNSLLADWLRLTESLAAICTLAA
jgi:hypothetical protein